MYYHYYFLLKIYYLTYYQTQITAEICTFNDLITPNYGISTHASRI